MITIHSSPYEAIVKPITQETSMLPTTDLCIQPTNNKIDNLKIEYTQDFNSNSAQTHSNTIIVKAFDIEITIDDLSLLNSNMKLNDNIVDFYLNLVSNNSFNSNLAMKVLPLSSFYFTRYNKAIADKKTFNFKHPNVFNFERVIIPIYFDNHWSLAVLDIELKKARFFDSLNKLSSNKTRKDKAKAFILALLANDLKNANRKNDLDEWIIRAQASVPQQSNGIDCGVFTCAFAKYVNLNAKIDFDQSCMSELRAQITNEIRTCDIEPLNPLKTTFEKPAKNIK